MGGYGAHSAKAYIIIGFGRSPSALGLSTSLAILDVLPFYPDIWHRLFKEMRLSTSQRVMGAGVLCACAFVWLVVYVLFCVPWFFPDSAILPFDKNRFCILARFLFPMRVLLDTTKLGHCVTCLCVLSVFVCNVCALHCCVLECVL